MEERSQISDIDSIVLPPETRELVKRLAEYNHGLWTRRMTDQGWQNGAKYEKESKTRPGLISWKKLPQSMQAQFLDQAQETIKAAIAWGYKIKGPVDSSNVVKDFISEKKRNTAIVKLGRGDTNIDLESSIELWRTRKFGKWSKSPKIYKQLSRQFLKLGESKNAYEVAKEGLSFIPRDVSLRQIMALALVRTGNTSRAIELAQILYDEGYRDEETLGLLGRAYKDLADKTVKEDDKKYNQQCSFEMYNQAFEETGGYYSGINAATLAVLMGEKTTARDIAHRVREKCQVELDSRRADSDELYWLIATLAETSLITNQLDEAEQWYKDAVKIAANRWGDQATTRRNIRLLMSALNYDSRLLKRLENCFLIPRIAIFFGRSLDQARELLLVDDLELNGEIKNSIALRLRKSDARIGYTAVISGIDILFLETVLEIGGEINAVLPFNNEMDIFENEWKERLNRVLNRANNVSNLQEHAPTQGNEERKILNEKITEMCRARSVQLDTEIVPLAIIDLEKEKGHELLSERIKKLREIGSDVQIIDPGKNYRKLSSSLKKQSENTASSPDRPIIKETLKQKDKHPETMKREDKHPEKENSHKPVVLELTPPIAKESVKPQIEEAVSNSPAAEETKQTDAVFLMAEAMELDKLSQEELVHYVGHFLGIIGTLLNVSPGKPIAKETWAGKFVAVFSAAQDAAGFALRLNETVLQTDWVTRGLPNELGLKIYLFTGPVFSCLDPVTGRTSWFSSKVVRAARKPPSSLSNQVLVDESFVKRLEAEKCTDFQHHPYENPLPGDNVKAKQQLYILSRRN